MREIKAVSSSMSNPFPINGPNINIPTGIMDKLLLIVIAKN
ncbi:hypothetical protein [Paenibacillus lautus]|nr:hypothetical protein [Paenibacillus lautus]MEC0256541.1 hypothetical protein [Paenibacillus lautus]